MIRIGTTTFRTKTIDGRCEFIICHVRIIIIIIIEQTTNFRQHDVFRYDDELSSSIGLTIFDDEFPKETQGTREDTFLDRCRSYFSKVKLFPT